MTQDNGHYAETTAERIWRERQEDLNSSAMLQAAIKKAIERARANVTEIDAMTEKLRILRHASTNLETYDAGLLGDYGGGDVSWWHDYLRAELGRAHDFYAAQLAGADDFVDEEHLWMALWNKLGDHKGFGKNLTRMGESKFQEIVRTTLAGAGVRIDREKITKIVRAALADARHAPTLKDEREIANRAAAEIVSNLKR